MQIKNKNNKVKYNRSVKQISKEAFVGKIIAVTNQKGGVRSEERRVGKEC